MQQSADVFEISFVQQRGAPLYYSTAHQLKRAAILVFVLLIPAQALSQSAVLDMTASPPSQGWTTITSGGGATSWVPGMLRIVIPTTHSFVF
jgi:hypothetical protein